MLGKHVEYRSPDVSFVYIDMLKLAVPKSVRLGLDTGEPDLETHAQYVALGSYDFVYYELPPAKDSKHSGLEWLEQRHELRHYLDWNYERHPVFLYAPSTSSGELCQRIVDVLDANAYPTRPLVLTMARIVKHTLAAASDTPCIDSTIEALQQRLEQCGGEQGLIEAAALWNLGNCDFMIISRPDRLELVRDMMLRLSAEGMRVCLDGGREITCDFASFSSYCAFRADAQRESRLHLDGLKAWLGRERDLEVHTALDALPTASIADGKLAPGRFVFGDRDFLFTGETGFGGPTAFDRVFAAESVMLDAETSYAVRGSSLILSLPMPVSEREDEAYDMSLDYSMDFSEVAATRNAFVAAYLATTATTYTRKPISAGATPCSKTSSRGILLSA